ncbi:MAG: DUF1080 domain-containing protein [Mucilaginibacter polytrichastri]|nr:DUF1080 domain-containing protein [Mucilaginibacter polytrichastri]
MLNLSAHLRGAVGPGFLSFLTAFSINVSAQQNRITVNPGKVLNPIPEQLYGACIEDVNHEIYGGLYDQKIFGESFEEPAPGPSFIGWKTLGGSWKDIPGGVKVQPGPGYKLISERLFPDELDVRVQLKFEKTDGAAGLLIHVNRARNGADNFFGYEISLDPRRMMIILGRHENNWTPLREIPAVFTPENWTNLRVSAQKNHIRVWVNDKALADFTDENSSLPSGSIALRTFNADVSFRNLSTSQNGKTTPEKLIAAPSPELSGAWDVYQTTPGKFGLDTCNAFNGKQSQGITHFGGKGRVGIANRSLNRWGIAVRKGQRFAGKLYLKTADLKNDVTVALQSSDGTKTYGEQKIPGIGAEWKKYAFSITTDTSDPNARFVCYIDTKGTLMVDQVTLMTTGADQFAGLPFRADIGKAMQQEGLNFLRYGGTMVNAPEYRFKNMIGDRDRRPPYKGHWYPYSTNGFGIEEFLQFCEAAGFEAAFAINIEETAKDAADMVEYLKGDTMTTRGKLRAKNGHPAPYKVKYFEIGNEEILFNGDVAAEYDHYIGRFTDLHTAMRAKDSTIRFVMAPWWRPESPNSERVFRALNGKADLWDLHTDADDPASGKKVDETLTQMRALFLKWDPNTKMKCAIFEENGGRHDLGRALGHATTLNAVRRHGDFVITSCAANALQPMGQNDNAWDQGQVFFTPGQVWGMPPFYAQKMAAANHLPLRIESLVEGDLDVTATRSENGAVIALHIVNTSPTERATALSIPGFTAGTMHVTQMSGKPGDVNSAEQPARIRDQVKTIPVKGKISDFTFPPYSYTILKIER